MDYTNPVVITTEYLGNEVDIQFPAPLDSEMQKGIKDLQKKRTTTRGRNVEINHQASVDFFNNHAQKIVGGIEVPEGEASWKSLVPRAVKVDMAGQFVEATSVGEKEAGN